MDIIKKSVNPAHVILHPLNHCPAHVVAPAQDGPNMQSFTIYLQQAHYIPEQRLQALFADLFSVDLSAATLTRYSSKLYTALNGFESTVLDQIKTCPLKHLDETGFRIIGKTQW